MSREAIFLEFCALLVRLLIYGLIFFGENNEPREFFEKK